MPDTPEEPMTREKAGSLAGKVYALVRACPPGRVTTYGWLANALGLPRGGARVVGWAMNETPSDAHIPAQRVINSKGELSGSWAFGQKGRMRKLLEDEGIVFDAIVFDAKERVDLKRYGWDPARDLSPEELARIIGDDAQPAPVSDNLLRLLLDDPASPFRIVPDTERAGE
jgi:methylated-DNA-protein-cysteine methyltransferase-like protein